MVGQDPLRKAMEIKLREGEKNKGRDKLRRAVPKDRIPEYLGGGACAGPNDFKRPVKCGLKGWTIAKSSAVRCGAAGNKQDSAQRWG